MAQGRKRSGEVGRCPVTAGLVGVLVCGGLELWHTELEEESTEKLGVGRPQMVTCRKSAKRNVASADERGN